ncbi:vreteno isoform X2 [Colletes latitarsis]|uniref:vreteno isoform X2 n=1 Tax=Colletes latitarsis TaxID=2605962 RepID=UPI004035A9D1
MAFYESDVLTKDTSSCNSKEFTLYVNNLPDELNEHGFLQIFNHYGTVIGQFYRKNANWAYVSYGTYHEAENCIRDLDNVPPLRLKVSFAKEKKSNTIQSITPVVSVDVKQQENYNIKDVPSLDRPFTQTKGRGKPLELFTKAGSYERFPKHDYTIEDDLLYSYPSDPNTFNPYESAGPYENTNVLWTRGQLMITQDGKRRVSFGRGYTLYELPDVNPEIETQICKVYEKRAAGSYEYGKDSLQNAFGKCQRCSKITKFSCERCRSFYCSETCQILDWPQHKMECQVVPSLVTAVNTIHVSQLNTAERTPRNISSIQMPLRRPKTVKNIVASPNHNQNTVLTDQDTIDVYAKTSDNYLLDNESKCIETTTSVPNVSNRLQSFIKKQENLNANNNIIKIEEDLAFKKRTFLSKSKFIEVRIIVKSGREFWIQKVNDNSNLVELMENLQLKAKKAEKVVPIVGNIYAVKYEDVWHRALVLSLDPLTVHYIDYGNDEFIQTDDFREIDHFKTVARFCAKIRLSEKVSQKYKDLKYEDTLFVKMISVDSNEVINVEVQGENDIPVTHVVQAAETSLLTTPTNVKVNQNSVFPKALINDKIPSPFSNLKYAINDLVVGETGIVDIHAELSNNTYSITLLSNTVYSTFEKLLVELPLICKKNAENSNHRPQIGELICGEVVSNGDWYRGYVLSLESPLKMAVIDEAKMVPIGKTVPCPEQFLNICAFGAIMKVNNPKYKLDTCEQVEFKAITRKGEDEIEIEIVNEKKDKFLATVKPWIPMPEQKGIQYAKLKSGSEVCLTAFRNHVNLYARSLATEEVEHYNRIMQSVAKCAQTAPLLKELPVVGEMVIAQYIDDNYYRAIVTGVADDKITIVYVDFGNIGVTSMKKLQILTDDLKELRVCTSKIILKDVPQDTPMTKEISDYLSQLVGIEIPLICTFDGIPSKDGVYLKSHSGDDINKTISELLVPIWKKTNEKDTTCYMSNDITNAELGKVGDVSQVVVTYTICNGHQYAMCPLDYELMTYIADIMPTSMTKYCEKSDYYIPRENELCLALYEGGWYRGVCNRRSKTSTTSTIFFIDFGNTEDVSHKDIRLMPKDFITTNSLASICNIVNLAPTDRNGEYTPEIQNKISELISDNNTIEIKIIQRDEESKIYDVELPSIRKKLIEEGLLSQ